MNVQKIYQYQMFSPTGSYLGLLPNVVSDFGYNQNLATTFTQLSITVQQTADTSGLPAENLTDEAGNPILDEAGNPIQIDRQPDLVGAGNSNALIANDNLIKVYEVSNYWPNGLLVFSGYVSKWKTVFGSTENIIVTCLSNGTDLDAYLVSSGDVPLVSQTTDDGNNWGIGVINAKGGQFSTLAQTFTIPSNTVIGGVALELTTPEAGTLTVSLLQVTGGSPSPSSDLTLISGSVHLGILSTKTVQKVTFPTFPTLVSGQTYYIQASWVNDSGSTNSAFIYVSELNPYANGNVILFTFNGASWTGINRPTDDAYFVVYQHGGNVTGAYVNEDPSFIMNDVMANYGSQGGLIGVPSGGYANTGVLTSYTFKAQTVLEAIQSIISLAPATWYWYVDPATGLLQFTQQNSQADLMIIKGRHINEFDLEATKENIKNTAYFTGGDDGTSTNTNIFVKVSNPLGGNRAGLALLSDNRVNSTAGGAPTARQIAQNFLNTNSAETFQATLTIQDQTMDLNMLKLGLTLGFAGFGTFADKLLLQIAGKNVNSNQAVLQVGSLPRRVSKTIADIETQLAYAQTLDNPSTPS